MISDMKPAYPNSISVHSIFFIQRTHNDNYPKLFQCVAYCTKYCVWGLNMLKNIWDDGRYNISYLYSADRKLKGLEKLEYWYRGFESNLGNKRRLPFSVCVVLCKYDLAMRRSSVYEMSEIIRSLRSETENMMWWIKLTKNISYWRIKLILYNLTHLLTHLP
jgi:hypothetical protein